MVQGQIIVPATEEQRKNFQDIVFGKTTLRQKFNQKLEKIDKDCTKEHRPFCFPCALLDYEDEINEIQKEIRRKQGNINPNEDEELMKVDIGELNKYAAKDYFNLLKSEPIDEIQMINGTKVPVRSYMRFEFKCKRRNHSRTVDMPWYFYEKNIKGKKIEGLENENTKV